MVNNKIFMFLLLGVFLISFASAYEFDNTYNYDEETKTATIHNCDFWIGWCLNEGEVLANLTLIWGDTRVARGIDRHVGTFNITTTSDTAYALQELELTDLKNGQIMTRGKQFKIKTIKQEDNYRDECSIEELWNEANQTYYNETTCIQVEDGKNNVVEWIPISNPNFVFNSNTEYEIGVFVDVEEGDRGDWIPTIFGVEVPEWAEWTEDMNVDIVSYWKMDDSSGNLIDSLGINNATYNGVLYSQQGKINTSIGFDGSNDKGITGVSTIGTTLTINTWFKRGTLSGSNVLFAKWGTSNRRFGIGFNGGVSTLQSIVGLDGTWRDIASSVDTNWHMVTLIIRPTNYDVYYDGSIVINAQSSTYTDDTAVGLVLGDFNVAGAGPYLGDLDEIGLWDRELTSSEINETLWDEGNGNTYTDVFGVSPSVTLISPANNSNLTSANIDFITTVTDDQQVDNVTLYIDGVANETNSSGFNGTYTFSKMISEGVHNWSILAIDNQSLENQSETRVFNLTIPPIFIDLLSPADASTHNIPTVNMSCTAYKDEGVTQLNLTIDGVVNISIVNTSVAENLTISQDVNFSEGNYTWGCSAINPSTSATSSNRTFEVLYSNPVINLFEPENDVTILINSTTFIFNASDVNGIANVSLFIDGVLNETNSSGVEGNYSFFRVLADGIYNWSVEAVSTLGKVTNSSTRIFLVHTIEPTVDIFAPSGFLNRTPYIEETLVYNISEAGENSSHFDECWYIYPEVSTIKLNGTVITTENYNLSDGTVSSFGPKGTDFITLDSILGFPPSRILTSQSTNGVLVSSFTANIPNCLNSSYSALSTFGPTNIGDYFCAKNEDSEYFLIRLLQIDVDNIMIESYKEEGLPHSLNCTENTVNFTYIDGQNNISIFAEDEFGFISSNTSSWEYLFDYWNIESVSPQYESTQGVFVLNTSIADGNTIEEAIFQYNGTNYTTSIITSAGQYLITSSIVLPSVDADTNFTFSFFVVIDGITYNFLEDTQEILNIGFITCAGIDLLMNISLFDEGAKTPLLGDIELNIQAYSKTSNSIVAEINNSYENITSQEICLSPNASFPNLYIDAEIRYFTDGYATEFYYIQDAALDDYPINLSLFDLNQNDSTEFTVTYKNNAFIFESDAVIQLQRKYIGEDTYEVVEAPLTGDGGKAVLHIDLNTNKYQASVVKDGELLDFFDNIVFSCDNELSGDCTYSLDGTVNPNNDIPIEDITDFTYSVSVNEINQTVTVLFAVPSGTPSSVNVLLEQKDMFANLTSCNTTVITSAGSITCDYTDTIEASILELSISKSNVELAVLSYVNNPDLDMDGMNFFIAFLFMISLVGMAIASPEWMVIISVMVLIISGTLLLLKGMNLVMGLGAIAWVIIAAAIIIMKMAKQEDR